MVSVGLKVEALFDDDIHWYSAVVTRDNGNHTYAIRCSRYPQTSNHRTLVHANCATSAASQLIHDCHYKAHHHPDLLITYDGFRLEKLSSDSLVGVYPQTK